jgi:hypothetical protein
MKDNFFWGKNRVSDLDPHKFEMLDPDQKGKNDPQK